MRQTADKYRAAIVYLALIIITQVAFWQVHNFDFVNYDDNRYVTENLHISTGLTFDNYLWAVKSSHFFMWHPVTSLSHMLDCQLFGLNPGWHHLVNLLFHIANVLLLFTVLRKLTGAFWQSAFVAALFAIHPLNVESVAWIAERKSVLGGFFSLLTIAAYIRYVKQSRPLNYLLVFVVFSLALMSKPTTVTLPLILLLLDYWPLERIRGQRTEDRGQKTGDRAAVWLIIEKIPLLLLSTIVCLITINAQKSGDVLKLNEYFPFHIRLANALVSYVSYIGKMIYPVNLTVFYLHPGYTLPLWKPIVSFALLGVFSLIAIRLGRQRPYLFAGWLWFLGTLVPMIGLVQAGYQAMADRYAYISLIGLFIIVTWGANDLLAGFRYRKIVLAVSSVAIISVLSVCTFFQAGYWRSSTTLFEHALKVTDRNCLAHVNLGTALFYEGNLADAINHWNLALQIKPDIAEAYNGLGMAYAKLGRLEDAIAACKKSIEIRPDLAEPYNNLGVIYRQLGRYPEAVESFEQAIKIKPDDAKSYENLGIMLDKLGRYQEAVEIYMYIIKNEPDYAEAYNRLGEDFGRLGQHQKAIDAFNDAVKLDPANMDAYGNLGITYDKLGRLPDAIQAYKQAIKVSPDNTKLHFALGSIYLKAGDKDSAQKEYGTLKTLDAKQAKELLNLIQK